MARGRIITMLRKALNIFNLFYSLLIVSVAWEIVGRSGIVPFFFLPPLSIIAYTFITQIAIGELIQHAWVTIYRALAGFALAAVLGVMIGLGMARLKLAHWFFDPIVALGLPLPPLVFVPLFIHWFGIGSESKILLVAFGCVFPIAVSTYNGAKNVDRLLLWSARMMGTGERKIMWKVVIPAATPFIYNGLRVALPISLIIAFVFEMVAASDGLGFLEVYSARFFRAPEMFSALFAIMIIGLTFDKLVQKIGLRFLRWHQR